MSSEPNDWTKGLRLIKQWDSAKRHRTRCQEYLDKAIEEEKQASEAVRDWAILDKQDNTSYLIWVGSWVLCVNPNGQVDWHRTTTKNPFSP